MERIEELAALLYEHFKSLPGPRKAWLQMTPEERRPYVDAMIAVLDELAETHPMAR